MGCRSHNGGPSLLPAAKYRVEPGLADGQAHGAALPLGGGMAVGADDEMGARPGDKDGARLARREVKARSPKVLLHVHAAVGLDDASHEALLRLP